VVLKAPAAQVALEVELRDPDGAVHAEAPFIISDPGMGIYSVERSRALDEGTILEVVAPERPLPLEPFSIEVEVLSFRDHSPLATRSVSTIQTDPKGEPVRLVWEGTGFRLARKGEGAAP
jgi:hypothetical protein